VETQKILFESLIKAEGHFEAGQIRSGQKLVNEVSRAMKSEGKVSNKLRRRFNLISAQSRYFNDISSFATNPKRNEIIQEIEALIATPIENPKKHANAIHGLQTKWQQLDQSSKPAGREQWQTFKKLTETAWEPCAQYYEELKTVKISNAKEREQIIINILQYTEEKSAKWPGLIELSKYLSQQFQLWQNFAPVLDDDFIKLKTAYQDARKPINDEIRAQENKNLKLKEEIIEKVKVINDEDTQLCIQKYQRLKRDYQNIGPAGKKNEPTLWKILNESADRFYEAEKTIANDEIKIIGALSKELGQDGFSLSKIKEQLRELTKTRKSPEFLKIQKAIKSYEGKQAEEIILQKVSGYMDLPALLESEILANSSIDKDILKALNKPAYHNNVDEVTKTVVMMELMAGIESPDSDKAIKQLLTLEMLQNKFSQQVGETEKLKGLLITFISNVKAKKLSAAESKLWKRAQAALSELAKHLP
jgi:DNA repair protein SbcC/Rad50